MKKYLLIMSDSDGNPTRFLDKKELDELLADPVDGYGIEEFLSEVPKEDDPQYWTEGTGLLLEITVLNPKPTTTAYKL